MSTETIASVSYYVLKLGKNRDDSRASDSGYDTLPGTDYYLQEAGLVYSEYAEHLLIEVTTDGGRVGWGEVQAPVAPEVAASVVETLVGPMVLGRDPRNVATLRDRMYRSMNVRGHFAGFMLDAIAGLDIALWDLKGKILGEPVSTLLGGRERETLRAYVTGGDPDHLDEGFAGIKTSVYGRADLPLDDDLRAVEDHSRILVEHHWRFDSAHEALLVDRDLEAFGVGFVECPLQPEDVDGSARLADALDVPVALGESLRTTHDFRLRLDRDSFDVGQPDVNRTGLTEGRRIADLLCEHGRPVAPHLSASLGPGVAATWHLSAAVRNFDVQEHNERVVPNADRYLDDGLEVDAGRPVVPDGDGLGIEVDEAAIEPDVVQSGTVRRE